MQVVKPVVQAGVAPFGSTLCHPTGRHGLKAATAEAICTRKKEGGVGFFFTDSRALLCYPQRKIIVGWTDRSRQAGAQRIDGTLSFVVLI